jgi:diacylglycerol kinase family enzyme
MMDLMSSDGGSLPPEHGDDRRLADATARRAAVVVNPTKIDDQARFGEAVERAMRDHGWSAPLWLETTPEDPGRSQAQEAVEAGADLVLACGGDGTVTACAEGLTDSSVPLAILPMGTGNLLARNVGLPAHWPEALAVALTGSDRRLDAGIVDGSGNVDGSGTVSGSGTGRGRSFVVMAGLGLDARMLRDTSEPLKRRLGWAAYAVSAVHHLRDRPMRVTVVADGAPPVRMRASAVIVGNVGSLRGGLPLMPAARPDDGLLDAVVLNARGLAGWLLVAAQVLTRRAGSDRLTRIQFTKLRLEVDRLQPWELDGEFMGETTQLTVTALPGKLVLRVPPAGQEPANREPASREPASREPASQEPSAIGAVGAPGEPAAT